MITLFIAVAAAFGGYSAAYWLGDFGVGWSVFLGLLTFGCFQFAVGMWLQGKVKAEMSKVQGILEAGQKRLQQKMQRWQVRPPGSVQAAQKEIADDTRVFVKDALAATEGLAKFRYWVPMIERQMATAQLQLSWMIRDFKRVDELMPKALFLDPGTTAIKLARQQMRGESVEEMEKTYKKGVGRLKYNQNVLLAAAWSWILVKRDRVDDAFKALTEALRNSDNEVLKRNHECLMNNRVAHFSNSGLGDQWYSLLLEEPKVKMQRPRSVYR
jgi:predicted ATPase